MFDSQAWLENARKIIRDDYNDAFTERRSVKLRQAIERIFVEERVRRAMGILPHYIAYNLRDDGKQKIVVLILDDIEDYNNYNPQLRICETLKPEHLRGAAAQVFTICQTLNLHPEIDTEFEPPSIIIPTPREL